MSGSAGQIIAGGAAVVVRVQDETREKLTSVQQHFTAVASRVGQAFRVSAQAVSGVAQQIVQRLRQTALDFASYGDAIAKAARRTSLSASAFSELGYAVERSGGNAHDLEAALRTMNRTVAQAASGSMMAARDLAALGLTLNDLSGLRPDEVLETIAERLRDIPNPVLRAERAMAIFGRAGARILPLLNDDIAALREQARDLRISISDEDAASAEALTDALTNANRVIRSVTLSLGAALAPALTGIVEQVALAARGVTRFVQENRQLVVMVGAVAAGIVGAASAVTGIAGAVKVFRVIASVISTARLAIVGMTMALRGALTAAIGFALTPVGAAIIGIAGAVYLLTYHSEDLAAVCQTVTSAFEDLTDIIGDALTAAMSNAIEAIRQLPTAFASAVGNLLYGIASLPESFAHAFGAIGRSAASAFSEVSDTIGGAVMAGVSDAVAAVRQLPASFASAVAELIADIVPLPESFGDVFGAVSDIAASVASAMRDVFSLASLSAAVESAMSSVAAILGDNVITNALRSLADQMTQAWSQMVATMQSAWGSLFDETVALAERLLGPLGSVFSGVVTSMRETFGNAMTGISDAISAVDLSFALEFVGLPESFGRGFADIRDTVANAASAIRDAFSLDGVIATVESVMSSVAAMLGDNAITNAAQALAEQMMQAWSQMVAAMQSAWSSLFDALAAIAQRPLESLRQVFDGAITSLGTGASDAIAGVRQSLAAFASAIGNLASNIVSLPESFDRAFGVVGNTVAYVASAMRDAFSLTWLSDAVESAMSSVVAVLRDNAVTNAMRFLVEQMTQAWSQMVSVMQSAWASLFDAVVAVAQRLLEPVRQVSDGVITSVVASVSDAIAGVRQFLSSVASAVGRLVSGMAALPRSLGRAFDAIVDNIADVTTAMRNAFTLEWLSAAVESAMQSVADALRDNAITNAARYLVEQVTQVWSQMVAALRSAWQRLFDGLAAVAQRLLAPLRRVFGGVVTSLRETFSEAMGGIADAIFAGDLSGALQVVGLTLQITWSNIVASLRGAWRSFTAFLVDSFWNAIEFVGTSAVDVFRRLITTIRDIANGIASSIESMILATIQGVNQAVADARIAAARFNPLGPDREQINRDRIQANRAARQMIDEIATQRERRLDDLLDPVLRAADRARQAVRDIVPDNVRNRDQQLREAEELDREPIAEMQRQLRELLERQRQDREIQETIRYLQSFGPRGFTDEFDLDGLEAQVTRMEARGTFSGIAATMLGGATDDAAERTERNTAEIARHTRDILRRLETLEQGRFD